MMLGEKIRDIRALKGLSQEKMADLLGIATTVYIDIERNKTEPSFQCLLQIAGTLEVDISSILSFGEEITHFFTRPAAITNARHYDRKDLLFALEKQKLEIEKLLAAIAQLKAEKEKTELELKYLMEK